MKLLIVAFILVLGATSHASGRAREFGPYLGGALSKNFATVSQPGVNASLSGWGNSLEAGFDLPFSDTFGISVGGVLGQKEVRNTAQSSNYLDVTKINTRGARGSFFYKSVYAGAGYDQNGVDLTTISTSTGASSAHLDANGMNYFVGYGFSYHKLLRAAVEAQAASFETTGFKYSEYSVALKLELLFNGLFDKD